MRLCKIEPTQTGAHDNNTIRRDLDVIPDGWAVIPADMECENFPFGEVEVAEIDGVMTVTKWIPGVMPEPTPPSPTQLDRIEAQVTYTAMMTDTLLEV